MEKILVVFTGGTIGSKLSDNDIIDVDESINYAIIDSYKKYSNADVIFDTISPLNILSENLLPLHWETLINSLAKQDFAKYKGIIVTHGTDTLPYTTAILSYVLCDAGLPVVFVASNYCIGEPGSNGIANFTAAVRFILDENLPGVFSIYENNKKEMIVYLGTRLLEADLSDGQYKSYQGIDFGQMINNRFVHNKDTRNAPLSSFAGNKKPVAPAEISIDCNIMCIHPYPGLNYSMLTFGNTRPDAVLHKLYHSSTACIEPDEYSLVNFAKLCKQSGVDLYLYDCKHYFDNGVYSSSNELMQTGVHPLVNISFEAALSKLYVAYSRSSVPPAEFMKKNIFFEYIS